MAKKQTTIKKFALIFTLSLFFSLAHADGADKFCKDPYIWETFDSLITKHPDDIPIHILHALRIGLCLKIEENSITTSEAIVIFNDMLDTVVEKMEEEDGEEQTEL